MGSDGMRRIFKNPTYLENLLSHLRVMGVRI